jgi:hypothetical protein
VGDLAAIVEALLGLVAPDALADLAFEDAVAAIELHLAPVRVRALPPVGFTLGNECSCNGYYEAQLDPDRPWILYADDVDPARARFTLVHEVGHHVFASTGAHLLDDLDTLAGRMGDPARLEELACHQFASRVLIPDDALPPASDGLRPSQLVELHEATNASWEAIAVRLAARLTGAAAALLTRAAGTVGFCATSNALRSSPWARGSPLDPRGPLARAHKYGATAQPDTYRWEMAYSRRMFCDTLAVHEALAIGVMTERPSDGHVEILEQPEPRWKEREEFCRWCGSERDRGWCSRCRGRYCNDCSRCACLPFIDNPVCRGCGLKKPFRECPAPRGSVHLLCECPLFC